MDSAGEDTSGLEGEDPIGLDIAGIDSAVEGIPGLDTTGVPTADTGTDVVMYSVD